MRSIVGGVLLLASFLAVPASAATRVTTLDLVEPVGNSFGIVRVDFVWSTPKTSGVVTAADLTRLVERYYAWQEYFPASEPEPLPSVATRDDGKVLALVYEAESIKDGAVVANERMVSNPTFTFDLDSETLTNWGWQTFAAATGTHHVFTKTFSASALWTRATPMEYESELVAGTKSEALIASNHSGITLERTQLQPNQAWAQCLTVPADFRVSELYLASRFHPSQQRDLIAQLWLGGGPGPSIFLDSLTIPSDSLEPFGFGISPITLSPRTEYCFLFGRNGLSGGGLMLHHAWKDKPSGEGPGFLTGVYRFAGGSWVEESEQRRLQLDVRGARTDTDAILVDALENDFDAADDAGPVDDIINLAGLGVDGLHSATSGQWVPGVSSGSPTLTFTLERRARIAFLDLWNYNFGGFPEFGIDQVEVQYSDTGVSWNSAGIYPTDRAPGADDVPAQRINVPDFDAGMVRLILNPVGRGLAELRFVPEPGLHEASVAALLAIGLLAIRRRIEARSAM